MINLRLYEMDADFQKEFNDKQLPSVYVSYAEDSNIVYYSPVIRKTVKDLIDEGYAIVYGSPTKYDDFGLGGTSSKGNRIRILNTCPYKFSQITDIQDVALNNKQIYSDENGTPINNIIVWNNKEEYDGLGELYKGLPSGFSDDEVIGLYNNKTINFQPQAVLFGNIDFKNVKDFELTFAKGGSWMAIGQGIFRGSSLGEDTSTTPENIKIIMQESYSSVFQRMFQHCHTTKRIEIVGQGLSIQANGLFEYDTNLEEIIFNCNFNWNSGDLAKSTNNMFHNCHNLKVVPLKASLEPTEANREAQTLKVTHGGNYDQMFTDCRSLTAIMPVLDFTNVNASDLVTHLGTFTGCDVLSDIRIKNLGNCDWDFVTVEGASLPAMDTASINYLLNNVSDVTEDGGHKLRLPQLHQDEVDASAIANAIAKGWNVQFGEPNM